MQSPFDAACTRSTRTPSHRANRFSFPPTQHVGLLDSTTRSRNQQVNLQRSLKRLLDALSVGTSCGASA